MTITYIAKLENDEGTWFLGERGMWCDDYADAHHFEHIKEAEKWVSRRRLKVDENGRPTGRVKISTIEDLGS